MLKSRIGLASRERMQGLLGPKLRHQSGTSIGRWPPIRGTTLNAKGSAQIINPELPPIEWPTAFLRSGEPRQTTPCGVAGRRPPLTRNRIGTKAWPCRCLLGVGPLLRLGTRPRRARTVAAWQIPPGCRCLELAKPSVPAPLSSKVARRRHRIRSQTSVRPTPDEARCHIRSPSDCPHNVNNPRSQLRALIHLPDRAPNCPRRGASRRRGAVAH